MCNSAIPFANPNVEKSTGPSGLIHCVADLFQVSTEAGRLETGRGRPLGWTQHVHASGVVICISRSPLSLSCWQNEIPTPKSHAMESIAKTRTTAHVKVNILADSQFLLGPRHFNGSNRHFVHEDDQNWFTICDLLP